MTRIAAVTIAALGACSVARAAEPRDVHIDVGSGRASLIATAQVEDYRAAPVDLLTRPVTGDSQMTRFLKTYYEIGRAGDTKRVASLFEPHMREGVSARYTTPQTLSGQFASLRSVRLLTVLHWGEYQFGFVEHESATEEGGTRRMTWPHTARCIGNTCQITDQQANSQLGGIVAAAFARKGAAQLATPAQGETVLPILPAVLDAAAKPVASDPIVLHFNRASDQTTLAVTAVVSNLTDNLRATTPTQPTFENLAALYSEGTPSNVDVFQLGNEVPTYAYSAYVTWFTKRAPWTVSGVYSLGADTCVALLKSDKDRALHLLPLQRTGTEWKIVSDPSRLDAWMILSTISTYQALQSR